jgi:hypothetical protein
MQPSCVNANRKARTLHHRSQKVMHPPCPIWPDSRLTKSPTILRLLARPLTITPASDMWSPILCYAQACTQSQAVSSIPTTRFVLNLFHLSGNRPSAPLVELRVERVRYGALRNGVVGRDSTIVGPEWRLVSRRSRDLNRRCRLVGRGCPADTAIASHGNATIVGLRHCSITSLSTIPGLV